MTEAFGQLTPVAADGQGLFKLELAALIDWFTVERR
jgi:hypothetical protein